MKKIDKTMITEVIKKSAMFLLVEIIAILLMTTILFFINVTVTGWHLPIITIIAIGLTLLFYRKDNIKINIVAILLGFIIFTGVTFVEGKIYDTTADGNTYHKLAIGALKNGWNPNYEDSQDFDIEDGNPFDISEDNINTLWIDHYAKGTEIFASVIYAFTGNIESGKGYTILLMYIAFGILFSYLYQNKKLSLIASLAISILLPFNAITVVQVFNYYVDGALMISILLILFACIIESMGEKENQKENLFVLASGILLCINIKFTGLAFAGIFCLAFYIYWMIKAARQGKEELVKQLKTYTIFYTVIVIVSIGIVGYSSYMRNMIDHGNPLYPLYGEGHVDNMVVQEQPSSFADKNHLEIFLISMFSKGVNVSPTYSSENVQPTLKIPFTTSVEEIKNYSIPDIRMSGFGPLFSGIFILSVIGTIYIIIRLVKEKNWNLLIPYGIILGITAILILALDGGYWARYIPYVYAVPIIVLTYLLWDKHRKLHYVLGMLLAVIMFINVALVTCATLKSARDNDAYVGQRINEFVQYCHDHEIVNIQLNHSGVQGALYNIDDRNVTNYEIKETIEGKNEGYFFKYE